MNNLYLDKETRNRLGDKSLKVYGTRSKWRKLCIQHGVSPEYIEELMDKVLKEFEEGNRREALPTDGVRFNRRNRRRWRKKSRQGKAKNGSTSKPSANEDSRGDDIRGKEVLSEQLERGVSMDEAIQQSTETPDSVE